MLRGSHRQQLSSLPPHPEGEQQITGQQTPPGGINGNIYTFMKLPPHPPPCIDLEPTFSKAISHSNLSYPVIANLVVLSFNWHECKWLRHNYLLVFNYVSTQKSISESTAILELQKSRSISFVCIKGNGDETDILIPKPWVSGRLALPKSSKYGRHLNLTYICTRSRTFLVVTNSSIFWVLASCALYTNKD